MNNSVHYKGCNLMESYTHSICVLFKSVTSVQICYYYVFVNFLLQYNAMQSTNNNIIVIVLD